MKFHLLGFLSQRKAYLLSFIKEFWKYYFQEPTIAFTSEAFLKYYYTANLSTHKI